MLCFPLVPLGDRVICLFFLNLRINCCTLLFCSHIQDLLQILWTKTKTFQFLLVKNITEPTGSSCRLSHKVEMKFARPSFHLKVEQKYRLLHLFYLHGNPFIGRIKLSDWGSSLTGQQAQPQVFEDICFHYGTLYLSQVNFSSPTSSFSKQKFPL